MPNNCLLGEQGEGRESSRSRARAGMQQQGKAVHSLVLQAQATLPHAPLTFLLLVHQFAAWEFTRSKKVLRTEAKHPP